jgi:hypothetical protein
MLGHGRVEQHHYLNVPDEELRKGLKVSSFNQNDRGAVPRWAVSFFRRIVPGLSPTIDQMRVSGWIQRANPPVLEYAKSRQSLRPQVIEVVEDLAPQAGFEPATLRLTAGCSTVELLRNTGRTDRFGPNLNSSESATPRAIRSSDRRGSPNAREGNRPSARHLSSI